MICLIHEDAQIHLTLQQEYDVSIHESCIHVCTVQTCYKFCQPCISNIPNLIKQSSTCLGERVIINYRNYL